MKKVYKVEVDCANCAAKMERSVKEIDGINDISINFMTQKMSVEFADGADTNAVIKEIIRRCRKIERDFEIQL